MSVRAVVPFKWIGAKSRLHPFLSFREREELAVCMLKDVIHALSLSYVEEVIVVVKGDVEELRNEMSFIQNIRLEIREEGRCGRGGLNEALEDVLSDLYAQQYAQHAAPLSDSDVSDVMMNLKATKDVRLATRDMRKGVVQRLLVMMSDLPLVTEEQINDVLRCEADMVIVPGRRGGTNAISFRNPNDAKSMFRFSRGISFLEHVRCAERRGLSAHIYDSFFFSTDIDEISDLIDLMVFGNGFASEYLRKIGVFVPSDEEHLRIVRRK